MQSRGLVFALLALILSSSAAAQTPPPIPQGPRLSGRVLDSSGAVMASATVRLLRGTDAAGETKTNTNGEFTLEVPAGEYRLEVSAPDFRTHEQTVRVTPNMAPLSIALTLAALATEVQVTTQATEVSIDPDSTLTNTTLTAEQLRDLPEDEEQLLAYLQQLAQASGAQGNANLIIDGIGGGRVPSRDQIQQIIINTNSFSATNSGGASIEIITRPGTQKWTGLFNLGLQDSAFDARNPLDANKANRQQRLMRSSFSGSLIPGRLTTSFGFQTTRTESEGSSIRAVTPSGAISSGIVSPNVNHGFNMSGQLYLSRVHTLNFNGNYQWRKSENQGVGGFNLPERASNGRGSNYQVQFNERAIFSPTFIHELRFRVARSTSRQVPVTEAVAINVLDAFNGGGAQNRSESNNTTYNWGNNLRYQVSPRLTTQSGLDFSYTRNKNISESNYLGSFTFASLQDYLDGRPLNFRQTTGNPLVEVSQLDFSAFFQMDWRINNKLGAGMGWRYQGQTNLRDYNNVAPTVNISYQLRQGTVVRVGARKTYSGFAIFNTEQLLRQDGTTRQFETVILNPSYPDAFAGATGTTTGVGGSTLRVKDMDLEAPHSYNVQFSIDHNLASTWRIGFSTDLTRGLHQLRSRNINAPFPGTPLSTDLLGRLSSFDPSIRAAAREEVDRMRPFYPMIGNIYQFESTGNNKLKSFSFRLLPPANLAFFENRFGVSGTIQYTMTFREDDSSAVNQYDWSEWARTGNRHNVNLYLNLRLPKGFTANMPITYTSGNFYSITTGRDENGDQATNDRPAGVARNSETGPSRYNVNLSVGKMFYLRRAAPRPAAAGATPVPAAAPAAGVVIPANLPPELAARLADAQAQAAIIRTQAPTTGPPPSGPRVQFSVSVQNLLNNTQYFSYSGVLTSPFFGQPVGTANGRRVSMTMTFSWQ